MADRYLLNGQPVSGFSRDADSIDYDNTGTGLSSTDVQGAITEINSNLSAKIGTLSNVTHSGNRILFEFTDGYKFILEVAKLDATHNYLQAWTGNNGVDKGYIIFDVSRNID